MGSLPFGLSGIPQLTSLWAADLSAVDVEAQHGEEFNNSSYDHATINESGVAGISPTWEAVCPVYPPDHPAAVDRRWYLPSMGLPVLDEAYLRYKVFVPAGFDYGGGGKMPGLAGKDADETVFDLAWGGNRPGDSWTSRLLFSSSGNNCYIYAEQPISPIYPYGMGASGGWSSPFTEGAWNTVLMHVKMNTPGVADGTFRLWVGGAEVANLTEQVEWRTESSPDIGVSVIVFNWGYGGALSDGPATAQTLHFAEFELLVPD